MATALETAPLIKYKLVSLVPAYWCDDETVPMDTCVSIHAFRTHKEAMWFLGKLDFSAWKFVRIEDPKQPVQQPNWKK